MTELERDIARIIAAYSFRAPIQVRRWIDKHAEGMAREVAEGLTGQDVWVDWSPDATVTARLCGGITFKGPAHEFNLNGFNHPTTIVGLLLPFAGPAIAAGTQRAETGATPAPSEGCQSGGDSRIAQHGSGG
jgi:hypothetical protein